MKKLLTLLLLIGLAIPAISGATLWSYYQEQGQKLPTVEDRAGIASGLGIDGYIGSYSQNLALESLLRGDTGAMLGGTNPIAGATYNLAGSGITASANSIILQSFTIPQTGHRIQDSELSDTFYLTIEPGNPNRQEIVSCTTVTQSGSNNTATLSGCTRGLLPFTPFTASSSYAFSHAGSAQVVLSDPPQLFNEFASRLNDETVLGTWTFANYPIIQTYATPTSDTQFVTKQYADSLAISASTLWLPSGNNIYSVNSDSVGIAGGASAIFAGSKAGIYNLISVSTTPTYNLYSQIRTVNGVSTTDSYNIYADNRMYGSTTNSYGIYTNNYQQILGTTTNRFGVYIGNPTNNGVITNNYGLYIPAQTSGTNNYGIYSNGPDRFVGTTTLAGNNTISGTTTISNATFSNATFSVLPTLSTEMPTTNTPVSYDMYNVLGVVSSSVSRASANTERVSTGALYKKFTSGVKGEVSVHTSYKTDGSATGQNIVISVNGFTKHSFVFTNSGYLTTTTLLSVFPGDTIVVNANGAGGNGAYFKDVGVYYSYATTSVTTITEED